MVLGSKWLKECCYAGTRMFCKVARELLAGC